MIDKSTLIQPATIEPDRGQSATPIHCVDKGSFAGWLAERPAGQRAALAAAKFKGDAGSHMVLADGDERARVLALSCEPSFLPPVAFAAFLAQQSAQWKQAVATLG